jgi:hypothetical protein
MPLSLALPRPIRACLCVAALLSCSDGPAGPPPGIPAVLTISPADLTLTAIGQTEQLQAEVADHYGDPLPGQRVAWTSDRPGTVMVDFGTGVATAVAAGTATVTATSGTLSARLQVTVAQEPGAIEKVAGDLQAGFIGEQLPLAAVVRVTDANGHPAGLVQVRFAVTSGGGSVAPASAVTNSAGLAQAAWTLGTAAGHALAATAGNLTAEFRATAERLPLTIETDSLARARLTLPYFTRLRARGGSTLGYEWNLGSGSRLPAGLRFDSRGNISGVPEDTATVVLEVRLADSEGGEAVREFTLRACDAPLGLEMGEVRILEADAIRGCGFYVQAPEAGAYYRVTLAGTDGGNTAIMPVALHVEPDTAGGRAVAAAAPRPVVHRAAAARAFRQALPARELQEIREVERANAALHQEIRQQEDELFSRLAMEGRLEVLPDRSSEVRGAMAADAGPSPPTRMFRLYNPTAEEGERCDTYTTLSARLVTENDHIAVYEDAEAAPGISRANADRILAFYEAYGAPVIERYFGGTSDVNGDGRVVVVVDPALNGIKAFVSGGDTLLREKCASSNEMELVRMSAGAFAQLDSERYWAFGGLVHEVKHVSSLYKRVRHSLGVAGEERPDFHPTWIEEGTAEIAKEMSSRLAWQAAGGPAVHERVTGEMLESGISGSYPEVYGILNLIGRTASAFAWFTDRPNAVTFRPRDRGNVYGSGWHYHRFLRDWFGTAGASPAGDEAFVTVLNDSLTAPGLSGIESVSGLAFEDLLTRHAVAMSVAGAEDRLLEGVPRFSSYDFPEVGEFAPSLNAPGHYPWPVTRTGSSDDVAVLWADLSADRPYRGELTGSGVRFHDFRAVERGASTTFLVEMGAEDFEVRVIVARIPDPAG